METNKTSLDGGYAPSWRKEFASEIWSMPPIYHRVWYWLRMNVQYADFLFPVRRAYGVWVLEGQRLTSIQQICEGVKWTEWGVEKVPNKRTIAAVLDWLKSRHMVTVESNATGTLITVVNWHLYNLKDKEKVTAESNAKYTPSAHKEEREERKEVKREPKPSSCPKPIKPVSDDAIRLSGVLADMILINNPNNNSLSNGKRDATVRSWAADIDKLIQIDNRPPESIEKVIRWSQSDTFWKVNILSGAKLRAKWDTLTAKMPQASGQQHTPRVFTGEAAL